MKPKLALALFLLAATANAQEVYVVSFANYPDGVHLLSITIVDGKVTIVSPIRITVLPAPATVPVVIIPTDPDEPETPDPLTKTVSTLVAAAPKSTNERATISKLLEMVGGLPLTVKAQILKATNVLWSALKSKLSNGWEAWKIQLDAAAGSLGGDDVKTLWLLLSKEL